MKTNLVIKGAIYQVGDEILVPHFTGEYIMVDCTRYMKKSDLLDIYDKSFFKDNKENFVIVDGEKYYYAEYSPFNVGDDWLLLSDLSEIEHMEENFDF